MLNTTYTNDSTNARIMSNIMKGADHKAPSVKQIKWLQSAIHDYNIKLDLGVLTMVTASEKITQISIAIAQGRVTKRVAVVATNQEIWYAVVLCDVDVKIKSFLGDHDTAKAKADVYPVLHFTLDIEDARRYAKDYYDMQALVS